MRAPCFRGLSLGHFMLNVYWVLFLCVPSTLAAPCLIKEGWYVDLVTVRDKCAARIKRDQKNQKAEPLMIAVPGFLSAVCSADELMLYPEVVGYAFDTVGRHNSTTRQNPSSTGLDFRV